MSDLPKRSIRITDLTRVDTPTKIDSKQELLFPVASNASEKDTFSMPLNSFVEWLLLKHAADKDLSNLSDIGQAILDAKQDYFNLINDDTDFDTFVNDGIYKVNVTGTVEVHAPTDATGFYVIATDTDNSGVIEQQARNLYINSGNIYHRQRVNGTWTNWGLITQDMESPVFIDAPTIINPGTNDDQLATIGQLNGKFSDIFKTEYHITEGVFVSGNVSYIDGSLVVSNGSKYITNDSNTVVLSEEKSRTIPNTGTHYTFINFAGDILYWDNFEKVTEFPSTMVEGTLYYNVMSDSYADSENSYSLTPLGTVMDGDFAQKGTIEFLNVENLQATLDALHVPMKVDQIIGDENQHSIVSSETQYGRNISAGRYENSGGEYSLTFGAGVNITSHSEDNPGEFVKDVSANMFAKDGENETSINITPTSAILTNPRLDEPSEIATLADIEEIKQTSLTFIGYVSSTEPSASDYSFNRGNLWILGSEMPETLPVPASDIKEWNGTAWVAHGTSYTPKDFDFFRNINDNEGYYWFGGAWKVMSTDMDTDYFVLGVDGKWKIKDDINLPGAPTTSTPAISDDSTKIATTAFVQSIALGKQNKLIAGENITIDEETNTISSTGGGGGSEEDNITITKNSDEQIQAVAVIDQNTGIAKTWTGTMAEYEAIVTKDPETEYIVTDDIGDTANLFRKEVSERNIGEIVYSTVPIVDSGLHLADGELLDGEGIYKDFYDYMVNVYNTGHTSIFCSESDYQDEITAHSRCGKYVLDTENKTIRLPNIFGHLYATDEESNAGTYVAPGLPNITAGLNGVAANGASASGAATISGGGDLSYTGGGSAAYWLNKYTYTINASTQNPVYGASDTVETSAIKVLVYIVVANTAKIPVQVDIDNIATELNACYAHRVVEFQAPNAENGYTWYRKYADGWVEQGGYIAANGTTYDDYAITLPILMADTHYFKQKLFHKGRGDNSGFSWAWMADHRSGGPDDTTSVAYFCVPSNSYVSGLYWEVKGMAS